MGRALLAALLALAAAGAAAKGTKEPPSPVKTPGGAAKAAKKKPPQPKQAPAEAAKAEPAKTGQAAQPPAAEEPVVPPARVSIGEVLGSKTQFNNKRVSLRCLAKRLNATMSHRGNAYYTFECDDATADIRVFSFGFPKFSENDWVVIEGTYHAVHKVAKYTFYNEVTADKVEREEWKGPAATAGPPP